jgi:hypothetical protein
MGVDLVVRGLARLSCLLNTHWAHAASPCQTNNGETGEARRDSCRIEPRNHRPSPLAHVVALVASLVQSGRAQCLLGNHDLNILLGAKKHDNWWFYGEASRAAGSPMAPAARR